MSRLYACTYRGLYIIYIYIYIYINYCFEKNWNILHTENNVIILEKLKTWKKTEKYTIYSILKIISYISYKGHTPVIEGSDSTVSPFVCFNKNLYRWDAITQKQHTYNRA